MVKHINLDTYHPIQSNIIGIALLEIVILEQQATWYFQKQMEMEILGVRY